MKFFSNYIFESKQYPTTSNKERREELVKWLQHKNYEDYVETLNEMLKDPKAKTLIEDGFGGELGDTKLIFSVEEIPVTNLMPTQSEIELDKSIRWPMIKKEFLMPCFKNPILLKKPIITFRKNYIIDGHHTWFQAAVLNPEGKILAFNYEGDISPIQMLKAVQGSIAAVFAEENKNNDDTLPSNKTLGHNIYDPKYTRKKIKEYIKENFVKDQDLIDAYCENIEECHDYDSIVEFITDRLMDIKSNNYPLEKAPKRIYMPQVFKAGTDKENSNTSMPTTKGSALNKLKDDKFVKSAIK